MNLSPLWVGFLTAHDLDAVHWSNVGDAKAPDTVLMDWARTNGHLVLTHDLDFSALIALAGLRGPSVVHVRSHGILPAQIGDTVVEVLRTHHESKDFLQSLVTGTGDLSENAEICMETWAEIPPPPSVDFDFGTSSSRDVATLVLQGTAGIKGLWELAEAGRRA